MISYDFNVWQFAEFEREGGHMIVRMSVPRQQKEPSSVQLIFDTGAYLTVISKLTAVRFKLPIGTGQQIRVRGFSGKQGYIDGELLEIPCIMLGRHFAYDVKVVVNNVDPKYASLVSLVSPITSDTVL